MMRAPITAQAPRAILASEPESVRSLLTTMLFTSCYSVHVPQEGFFLMARCKLGVFGLFKVVESER